MIVVKVELHSAKTGKVTLLGKMYLSNDGVASAENDKKATYKVKLLRKPNFKSATKETVVANWSRVNKTIWQLVQKALNQLYS